MTKLKFTKDNFKSFSNSLFIYIFFYNIFFIYVKISENLSAKYYQGNKERLQKKACGRYQNLSEEEKRKKPQYCRELCKNLSEDEKNKVAE